MGKAHGLPTRRLTPGPYFCFAVCLGKLPPRSERIAQFPTEPLIPVVFRISFQDPSGYFLATQVLMRNQDLIFIANAQSVEVTKFLQLVNLAVSAGSNGGIGGLVHQPRRDVTDCLGSPRLLARRARPASGRGAVRISRTSLFQRSCFETDLPIFGQMNERGTSLARKNIFGTHSPVAIFRCRRKKMRP